MNSKEFVAKIVADNQALFQASQHNVKAYFDSKPAQTELVEHFIGFLSNCSSALLGSNGGRLSNKLQDSNRKKLFVV